MPRRYETWAYLNDEGKKIWGDIFPNGEVPVRSLLTQQARLEGAGTERVFLVAWDKLTIQQKNAIVERLSKNGGEPVEFIWKVISQVGLPLREKLTDGAGTTRAGLFI